MCSHLFVGFCFVLFLLLRVLRCSLTSELASFFHCWTHTKYFIYSPWLLHSLSLARYDVGLDPAAATVLLQDSDVRVIVPEHAAMSVAVFRVLLALLRRGTNAQSVEVWKILRSGTNLKALIELVTANQIMWEEFNSGAKLMVILELLTETSPVHKPPERTLDILAHAALAVGKSLGFLQVR